MNAIFFAASMSKSFVPGERTSARYRGALPNWNEVCRRKGRRVEVELAVLDLPSSRYFRDLGGYETTDSRFVRLGLLYRSGVLTYLTPADYKCTEPAKSFASQ